VTNAPGIASPCVRNCCLDERDVCLGCGRSLDEIRLWSVADDAERLRILERAASRRAERVSHRWPDRDQDPT
jgi:uncharacterized protein